MTGHFSAIFLRRGNVRRLGMQGRASRHGHDRWQRFPSRWTSSICYAFIVTYDAFVSVNEYRIPYSSELLNRERYEERRSTGSQRLSENGKQMQRHRLVSVISKSLRRTGRRSCTLTSTNISPFSFCSIKGQLGAIEIIRKTFNSYY